MAKKKVVVLSGAGMSAESGLSTFRDAGGLWERYDVMQVASPVGWAADMDLVLEFYNQRRRHLLEVNPNIGHRALAELDRVFDTTIITQNIDDLHERAGSKEVIHVHGELLKARSTRYPELIYPRTSDIRRGDLCERGAQLRPHVVWFGEAVPMMETAIQYMLGADIVIVVGTSMQVYPAAGLVYYSPVDAPVYYIDPMPQVNHELASRLHLKVIPKTAGDGVPQLVRDLIQKEEDVVPNIR